MADKTAAGPAAGILAGVLGGGLFLLFWLLLGVSFFLALVIGAAGFGAGLLIFRRRARRISVGLDPGMGALREEALKEGRARLAEIRGFAARIRAPKPRATAEQIVAAIQGILDDLARDSRDVRVARQAFSYYLDAAARIMGRYVELSGKDLGSAEISASLTRAEGALDTLLSAFRAQHGRVLENDVMDLDTEIALLKKSVDMDGIGENKP